MTCPRCGRKLTDVAAGRVCSHCGIILPATSEVACQLLCLATDSAVRFHLLDTSARELAATEHWDELEALLLAPSYLEAKVQAGMVFKLAEDLALALERLPQGRPWRRVLSLLEEAFLRDLHFIARYPEALFQSLWNSCWWHDCPEAAGRYDPPKCGWPAEGAPWNQSGPKLSPLMESWRQAKQAANPRFVWLRSLRPVDFPLGGPQRIAIPVNRGESRLLNLQFSADGRRLFGWLNPVGTAGVSDRQFRAWDAATGLPAVFQQHEVPSYDPHISPDGRWRVECGGEGGGWGKPVRILETATDREVASLPTDEDVNIQKVEFSPDSQWIIGGGWSEGGEAMIWNVATRQRLHWLQPFRAVFSVAISFGRKLAATGSSGGEILLWDLDTGEQSVTLRGHEGWIEALAFAPDGARLVSASNDGTMRVWDLSRSTDLPRVRDHPDGAESIEFSEDGTRMLTFAGDETTWLWDAQSGAPVNCLVDSAANYLEGGPPLPAVAIRNGQVLSLLRGEVWDAATGAPLRSPGDRLWARGQTVWSADGKVAIYGHRASIILTANLFGESFHLQGHEEGVTDVAFSPDSRLLATASFDKTVRVSDTGTGKGSVCFRGHEQPVSCVAFSPDGRFIASGAADQTVRVWKVSTGEEFLRIDVDAPGCWCSRSSSDGGSEDLHAVRALAFTLDGRGLVTDCGGDFRLWDRGSGTLVRAFTGRASLEALAAACSFQAFIRGNEMVIERYDSGMEFARAPVSPGSAPVPHPDGRIWAAGGRWLHHFSIVMSDERVSDALVEMISDAASARLVKTHLEVGISELERDASEGRYNTLCIRALGGAARVLGQHEVADRAVRLLRLAPDAAFWAGTITNIELPETVPEGMRIVEPTAELEDRHPPYRADELIGRIRSCAATEKHFALCLEGRFQEARALVGSGVQLEEVGDTLAVLGEFDAARSVAKDPALEPFRRRGVLFVLVIELFRRGRAEEAGALLAELESARLGAWERIHLALGLAGREPWGGYPYPDW